MASMVAITFGILPYLANLSYMSYSLWVRRNGASTFAPLISHSVDDGTGRRGHRLLMNTNGKLTFRSNRVIAANYGLWQTDVNITDTGVWHHVAVTYDNTSAAADPIFYVDNVVQAITEVNAPVGAAADDSDAELILFNNSFDPLAYVGKDYLFDTIENISMKNVRIYSRILQPSEIADLYNIPTGNTIIDGLLFHGVFAHREQRGLCGRHNRKRRFSIGDCLRRSRFSLQR